ncbi:hypothetical protein JCM10449v2_002112 [Rhodotorula kratochvilovae]
MSLPGPEHLLTSVRLHDCSAFVRVNGQPAPLIDTWKDREVSGCYVEAVSGASFEVSFADERVGLHVPKYAYELSLWVDNNLINREVVSPTDALYRSMPGHKSRTFSFSGQPTGERELTKLRFADVRIKDDSTDLSLCRDRPAPSAVGVIELTYCRIEHLEWVDPLFPIPLDNKTYQKGYQPRSSLNVAPADKTEAPCVPWRRYDRIDAHDSPLMTFSFRYETRGQLQALGFLPERTPSPAPDPSIARARAGRHLKVAHIQAGVAALDTASSASSTLAAPSVDIPMPNSSSSAESESSSQRDKGKERAVEGLAPGRKRRKTTGAARAPGVVRFVETIVLVDSEDEGADTEVEIIA